MLMFVLWHGPEGEGQFLRSSQCRQPGEEIEHEQTSFVFLGQFELRVQEQILVSDADLRHRRAEEEISQSGEQFIKIEDQVGLCFLDLMMNERDTFRVFRKFQQVI